MKFVGGIVSFFFNYFYILKEKGDDDPNLNKINNDLFMSILYYGGYYFVMS